MNLLRIASILLQGFAVTVGVGILSMILAAVLAFAAAFMRRSRYTAVRAITAVYVEFFRGTSLLVQLFWIYFVFPFFGVSMPAFLTAVLAIGLNFGAYGSEIVRGAINSIPAEQTEACIALGFTKSQRMWNVILPQAFVIMLPSFGNMSIELIKSTALVSLITLGDLTYQATILKAATMQTGAIYGVLLVIYFLITRPFAFGIRQLERKLSVWRG